MTQPIASPVAMAARPHKGLTERFFQWTKRKPVVAFFLCTPLLALIFGLVIYPFFYAIFLSMLN